MTKDPHLSYLFKKNFTLIILYVVKIYGIIFIAL